MTITKQDIALELDNEIEFEELSATATTLANVIDDTYENYAWYDELTHCWLEDKEDELDEILARLAML